MPGLACSPCLIFCALFHMYFSLVVHCEGWLLGHYPSQSTSAHLVLAFITLMDVDSVENSPSWPLIFHCCSKGMVHLCPCIFSLVQSRQVWLRCGSYSLLIFKRGPSRLGASHLVVDSVIGKTHYTTELPIICFLASTCILTLIEVSC